MTREPRRSDGVRRARGAARRGPGLASTLATVLAVAIVLIGALLRTTLPPVRQFTPDEQTYTTFAAGLAESGLGQYARTVREFAKDSTLAELPPPTRVGFLLLATAAMKLTGRDTPYAIVGLSTAASIVLLIGAAFAAGVLAGPGAAAITAILLAVSPMDLAIARRAWQDDVFALVAALVIGALAWRAARGGASAAAGGAAIRRERKTESAPDRRSSSSARATLAFFVLCGASLLVKESALALLAVGTAFLAWNAWRERGPIAALPPLAGFVLTIAAVVGLLAAIAGWEPVWRTWRSFVSSPAANPYVAKYQTGSPLYYARGLLLLQPLAAGIGSAGVTIGVLRPRWLAARSEASRRALFALAVTTAGFAIVTALLPVKSLRFLSPAFPPAAILGAAAVVAGLRAVGTRTSRSTLRLAVAVVAVVLALSAWQDLRRFYDLFVRRGIPDLATPWFTQR